MVLWIDATASEAQPARGLKYNGSMPKPQLIKIVTGGQTGADQGALLAARAAGIATGGWAPLGWMTEDGPAPWLADFRLIECPIQGTAQIAVEISFKDDAPASCLLKPLG